jgi:hypothetical protein
VDEKGADFVLMLVAAADFNFATSGAQLALAYKNDMQGCVAAVSSCRHQSMKEARISQSDPFDRPYIHSGCPLLTTTRNVVSHPVMS